MRVSGVRGRTRRAILHAAATVLSRRRDATPADIAAAADVGRSTLQRYFPDRELLLAAVVEDCLHRLAASLQEARIDQGPPSQGLRRVDRARAVGPCVRGLYGGQRRDAAAPWGLRMGHPHAGERHHSKRYLTRT
ncbi:TetR family transcriptional regulator [Streptomyces massasporeus]